MATPKLHSLKKLKPNMALMGMLAYSLAKQRGVDFQTALRFAGYATTRMNTNGLHDSMYPQPGNPNSVFRERPTRANTDYTNMANIYGAERIYTDKDLENHMMYGDPNETSLAENPDDRYPDSIANIFRGAQVSKHKYANGINGQQYEQFGKRLIAQHLRNKYGDKFTTDTGPLLNEWESSESKFKPEYHPVLDELQENIPEAYQSLDPKGEGLQKPNRMGRKNKQLTPEEKIAARRTAQTQYYTKISTRRVKQVKKAMQNMIDNELALSPKELGNKLALYVNKNGPTKRTDLNVKKVFKSTEAINKAHDYAVANDLVKAIKVPSGKRIATVYHPTNNVPIPENETRTKGIGEGFLYARRQAQLKILIGD